MLFIIECKTWGREFDKALTDTKNDGAQLFSYWQQEQSCKWLVLYASDLKAGTIEYKTPTIDCSDDANIILLSKKDNPSSCTVMHTQRRTSMRSGRKRMPAKYMMIWFSLLILSHIRSGSNPYAKRIFVTSLPKTRSSINLRKYCVIIT